MVMMTIRMSNDIKDREYIVEVVEKDDETPLTVRNSSNRGIVF